jgi:hypothetical protein
MGVGTSSSGAVSFGNSGELSNEKRRQLQINGHATPSPLAFKQIDTLLNQLGSSGKALRTKYFPVGKVKT